MGKNIKYISIFSAIGAALLYALSSPVSKLLLDKIPETIMAGILYIGAGVGISIISFIQRVYSKDKHEETLSKGDTKYVLGMILLDIAAPILLMTGLKITTAANASLLNNFEIAATSIIAMCIFHEKISKKLWIGIGFITLASILLSIEDAGSFSFSLGSIFVLGACVCWGFENNCTKMISEKNPVQIVQIKGFFSGAGSIIVGLILGQKLDLNIYMIEAAFLGFISYGLSITLYIYAQRKLGAAKTSAYYALSPFISSILSLIIFREIPSSLFLGAAVFMAVGVFFITHDSDSEDVYHHHDNIYSIDFYAYNSNLKNINTQFKVCFAFIVLLLCILADNVYVSSIIVISMGFITIYIGGLKFHEYISLMTIPIIFMLLGSIAIAAGASFTTTGQYNLNVLGLNIYTSNESLLRTFKVSMTALGAVSSMYMMTLSTNTSEIISVLRKIHMPKLIIELMNMIYRFIFILMDVQCKMKNSAQSRLGYVDFKTSCYSFGSTASNLLIVSLKKANAYYDSMEARCYDGDMLFLEEEKKINNFYVILSAAYIFILMFIWYITK
ncbi:MAG: cobalt ECF transporter T component CbiQ [Clostridium sp.]